MLRLAALALTCCFCFAACDASLSDDALDNPAAPVGEPGPALSPVTIAAGLVSWRKAGAIQGGASCASCHAPDAFDLAYFDFDDQTIRRRVAPHLGERDAQRIVELVKAIGCATASRSATTAPTVRFSRAGRCCREQTSPSAIWRFGRQMVRSGLGTTDVLSPQIARRERDRWMANDPRTFRIGLALNRWSEDPHEGDASIADWLPDLPRFPRDADAERALFAAHDAYLSDSTDQALFRLLDVTGDLRDDERIRRQRCPVHGAQIRARSWSRSTCFAEEVRTGSLWGNRPSSRGFQPRLTRTKVPTRFGWSAILPVSTKEAISSCPPKSSHASATSSTRRRRVKLTWFSGRMAVRSGLAAHAQAPTLPSRPST